jgi:Ca2+:H+ antiporter
MMNTQIGINAIAQKRPHISQSVILGSVLSNLLLVYNPNINSEPKPKPRTNLHTLYDQVLGSTLFISGYDKKRLRFDRTLTTVLSSLMTVVFILLAIPTIMEVFPSAKNTPTSQILFTQRITAVILIALLMTFLLFRLGTHAAMFASTPFAQNDANTRQSRHQHRQSQIIEAQLPRPYLGKDIAGLVLAAASGCTFGCTYYIVDSLAEVAGMTGSNESFLAVTIVPILGNFVKYHSIVTGSRSYSQVELGIRAIINSVLRVTMLIVPLLVLVGWVCNRPLILRFDGFEATTLLLSVVVMTYLISDGRSNYFEGLMLIGT